MLQHDGLRLGALCDGRDNNLNLVRVMAASSVLVSHAYAVTGVIEPFAGVFGPNVGHFAVVIFFAISGLLITRSFDRSPGLGHWIASRVLRMYPGLFVALMLAAFVLGPVVTTLPGKSYFASALTWRYVPSNLTLYEMQFNLPGVFERNPYPIAVNGSLWTLFYEVACYGGVLCAGIAGLLAAPRRLALGLVAYVIAHAGILAGAPHHGRWSQLDNLADLSFPFVLGMAAYVWRDRIVLNRRTAAHVALCAVGAVLLTSLLRGSAHLTWYQTDICDGALAYLAIWFGYAVKNRLLAYNALGDYSYGIYIYAFPIQQTWVLLLPHQAWWQNVALALPTTAALAVVSWHLVERPALSFVRGR